MSGYDIGISGFHAAQQALNIVGNNIANAATEGYHRQSVDFRPNADTYTNGLMLGQGVSVEGVIRLVDTFLESELINQESSMAQITRELESLRTIESALGELSMEGLSVALDNFFGAIQELAAHPTEPNYQNPVISTAESLCIQLRNMGSVVSDMQDAIYTEARSVVTQVNVITDQIAQLNSTIRSRLIVGDDANNILDQRDQLVTDLSQLIGITTYNREYGVVDIVAGDTPLVIGSDDFAIQAALVASGSSYEIGISPEDVSVYNTSITGGKIGALVNLRGTIVDGISTKLDTLARGIANQVNRIHVQGVGTAGSFTSQTGGAMTASAASDFVPSVSDGNIYLRLTAPDGTVTRNTIAVDTATDTLATMAAKFNVVTGLTSSVTDGKLDITADANYTFDFLPGVLASPVNGTSTMTGSVPTINISGDYSGSSTKTYTCTVSGTGTVGAGTLTVTVNDGSGDVATLDLGTGYVPGSTITVVDGIEISIGPGDLNNGQLFQISAVSNSDPTGFLAATGINCFFTGATASSIAVSDYVGNASNGVSNIAVRNSVSLDDNRGALAMAALGDTEITDLGSMTMKEYYRDIVIDVANQISNTELRGDNAYGMWQGLSKQRSEVSGVDMNDEAAKMLMFEKMFQGMAKYINAISTAIDTLMSIVG